MIYFVSNSQELFEQEEYKCISAQESLDMMHNWKVVQLDSETTGKLKILEYLRTFIRL